MFDSLMTVLFLAPVSPSDTWAGGTPAVNQAQSAMRVQAEIVGRPTAGCRPPAIALPPARSGVVRFQDGEITYEGTEAPSGALLVRSNGPRPLTLTGDRSSGGRWSLGTDGKCVGVWKPGKA